MSPGNTNSTVTPNLKVRLAPHSSAHIQLAMYLLRTARTWASRLSPEAKENARLVVQGAQFAAACYFVNQFLIDVSMVSGHA